MSNLVTTPEKTALSVRILKRNDIISVFDELELNNTLWVGEKNTALS